VRLIALVLLAAAAAGFALGGRASRLGSLDVRWRWTGLIGLVLQLLPLPGSLERLSVPLLVVSLGMPVAFVAVNLRYRGFELVLIGLALNVLVISLNGGMPVSRAALRDSGQLDSLAYLERAGGAKHHLAGPGDDVMWLGDVIAVPTPIGLAISIGDVIAYAGVGVFVTLAMTERVSRRRRTPTGPLAEVAS
jgi:Family of unknown function (DUF5317)